MSHHILAIAVSQALDRAREDEIVVVRGEQIQVVRFGEIADERILRLLSKHSIAPVPWPRRWLLEDEGEDELTIYDVQSRRQSAVA